jgi:hypothetical protein
VAVIVMRVIVRAMIIMGVRSMSICAVRVVVMLHGIAARAAPMRSDDRYDAREDGAQQRQEYDCLDHRRVPLRMISVQTRSAFVTGENRLPLFRIMRISPSSD